jgi:hypothetical protein
MERPGEAGGGGQPNEPGLTPAGRPAYSTK